MKLNSRIQRIKLDRFNKDGFIIEKVFSRKLIKSFKNKLLINLKKSAKKKSITSIKNIKKLDKSVISTNFNELKKMEKSLGFDEASLSPDGTKKTFFNLGKQNNYKKLLSSRTTQEIERIFNKEMKELKYL